MFPTVSTDLFFSAVNPFLKAGKIRTFLLIKAVIFAMAIHAAAASATTPERYYMAAESCYKSLSNSLVKKQSFEEWWKCIKHYQIVYTRYPNSSWAPAGMYMAADVYLKLFELSENELYLFRANDLLIRLKNKYPGSKYSRIAKAELKKLERKNDKVVAAKLLKSKKKESFRSSLFPDIRLLEKPESISDRNISRKKIDSAIKQKPETLTTSLSKPDDLDKEVVKESSVPDDSAANVYNAQKALITDLRFWSNPEYSRIVIYTSQARSYKHNLLKKDLKINKPLERLYVDIDQSILGNNVPVHTPINDELLKEARAGQYNHDTVRVVVDIKSFENYKIFSLKDPFRIVIDICGKGTPPVSELPAKKIIASKTSKKAETLHRISTDHLKSSNIARQLALGVKKIVIDPGHGGSDPGAPGAVKGVWEKNIVLNMSKILAEKLRSRLKCTVVLTRTKDKKITLEERPALANTERADLFISLHCNAAKSKKLTGIETYLLNLATDDQAIAVAARENATSKKNISDLDSILTDLMKYSKIEESKRLAKDVHQSMVYGMKKKYSGIMDRGVKQAPFYVLLGARMPAILIETSFISNANECKHMLTESYINDICTAITNGIEKYINETNPREF